MQDAKRKHICDTDDPQRPCCWATRRAEIEAMKEREKDTKWLADKKAAEAKIDGFIIRGVD